MTSTVKLLKPASLYTNGYRFVKGVETPVPFSVARNLEADERFEVSLDRASAPNEKERKGVDELGRPINKAVRLAAIRTAADKLDVDNEDHFTKTGKPDARALTSILGWQVTSEERDQAMAAVPRSGGQTDEEVLADAGIELDAPVVEGTQSEAEPEVTKPEGADADLPPEDKDPPGHFDTLLGSNVLPSDIELAEGVTVQLGDVVRRAHNDSGMSLEDWNKMPDDEREELLQQAVEIMKIEAAPPAETVPAPTKKTKGKITIVKKSDDPGVEV